MNKNRKSKPDRNTRHCNKKIKFQEIVNKIFKPEITPHGELFIEIVLNTPITKLPENIILKVAEQLGDVYGCWLMLCKLVLEDPRCNELLPKCLALNPYYANDIAFRFPHLIPKFINRVSNEKRKELKQIYQERLNKANE